MRPSDIVFHATSVVKVRARVTKAGAGSGASPLSRLEASGSVAAASDRRAERNRTVRRSLARPGCRSRGARDDCRARLRRPHPRPTLAHDAAGRGGSDVAGATGPRRDPGGVQGFDSTTWYTLAARNLCLAEEQNLNILTACSGCFETLKVSNTKLKNDSDLKDKVNEHLSQVGREFKGTIEVKHFAEVLYTDVGIDKIAARVQKPLTGLKLATHTGCHYVKPPELLQTDNPSLHST